MSSSRHVVLRQDGVTITGQGPRLRLSHVIASLSLSRLLIGMIAIMVVVVVQAPPTYGISLRHRHRYISQFQTMLNRMEKPAHDAARQMEQNRDKIVPTSSVVHGSKQWTALTEGQKVNQQIQQKKQEDLLVQLINNSPVKAVYDPVKDMHTKHKPIGVSITDGSPTSSHHYSELGLPYWTKEYDTEPNSPIAAPAPTKEENPGEAPKTPNPYEPGQGVAAKPANEGEPQDPAQHYGNAAPQGMAYNHGVPTAPGAATESANPAMTPAQMEGEGNPAGMHGAPGVQDESSLPGGGCALQIYTASQFQGSRCLVTAAFSVLLDIMNMAAQRWRVKLHVLDSARAAPANEPKVPTQKSNHMAGHAIDVDIVLADGKVCNAACLGQLSSAPSAVRLFIEEVRGKNGIRWGGDWEQKDPVHFDDGLNTNAATWQAAFERVQSAFKSKCFE
jgi:D-alanyl-D-alanine carboxypeptidase